MAVFPSFCSGEARFSFRAFFFVQMDPPRKVRSTFPPSDVRSCRGREYQKKNPSKVAIFYSLKNK